MDWAKNENFNLVLASRSWTPETVQIYLQKLDIDKYQYFISQNFDSTKIDDLKSIYKNLLFVKNEILTMVK